MTIASTPRMESRDTASSEAQQDMAGDNVANGASSSSPDVATSVFMGTKPVLKNWKMFGDVPQEENTTPVAEEGAGIADAAPSPKVARENRKISERVIRPAGKVTPVWLQIGQALAVFATVAWLTYAAIYILALPNSIKTITSSPLTLGGVLASVLAPIAMLWLCIATWQRRSDAHIYAEALREELRGMFYPDADQSNQITEDIRGMMQQATEMSAASRGAIKAIQRARTGLRAEIRDFAGVSQKTEFHIDRLAETLSKRAEELLSMTEIIERQTENISVKAERGVTQWENVSAEISELGDEIEQIFDTGANKLQSASEAATARIQVMEASMAAAVENLSTRIGGVAQQIEGTRGNLEAEAGKLFAISESLSDRASRLEDGMMGVEKMAASVGFVVDALTENLQKADETALMFEEKVNQADDRLSGCTDVLKETADLMLKHADNLNDLGDLTTNKFTEALTLAISGADTISNAVRKSKETMEMALLDATSQMETTSQSVEGRMSGLMEESLSHKQELAALINDISRKCDDLSSAISGIQSGSGQVLNATEQAVRDLNAASARVVQESKDPIDQIYDAIERLDREAAQMDDRLATRLAEISQGAGMLKTGLDQFTQSSEQIALQHKTISEEIQGQKTSLTGFVQDIEAKTRYVAELLAKQNETLEHSILNSGEKISSLGAKFFDKGDSLIEKVDFVTGKVNTYETTLNDLLASVRVKADEISGKVETQIGQLSRLSENVTPKSEQILGGTKELLAHFEELESTSIDAVSKVKENLVEIGAQLDARLAKLGDETIQKSKAFTEVSDEMAETMATIGDIAARAEEKISTIHSGIRNYLDDVHLVSDQMQLKVGAFQSSLGDYAKDLNDVLQFAVSDLEFATEKFSQTTGVLNQKAETVTSKILEATRLYTEEGHRMSLLGEQAAHKSARIVTVIQQESERLVSSSKSSLLELQKAGDSLSIRTREIEDYLKASVHHAKTYSDGLREEANLLAGQSQEMADRLSEATMRLTAKAHDVRQAGQEVSQSLNGVAERLEGETTSLGRVAVMTVDTVDDAVSRFSSHSEVLQSSVMGLIDKIQSVKNTHAKTERDQFLNAAKFVIESLYSLSVDVARHLDGDLDTRVLRSYQKGDVTIYVRHLVESSARIPVEKSQRKFIEDSEFRTYVLRFIRQYEELLEQAQVNDYSDLLSSVFSTSDIGKLYKILCEVAGRSSKEH